MIMSLFHKKEEEDKPAGIPAGPLSFIPCSESYWLLENGSWKRITDQEFIFKEVELGVNLGDPTKRVTDGFHKNNVMGRILWYLPRPEHFWKREEDFVDVLEASGMFNHIHGQAQA